MNGISNWFLRIAVVYLIAGVSLGIFMAASQNHSMAPVHAHLNLLGWVSMGLFGVFYRVVPRAAETRLAKVHFGIYVPAHFVQMALLTMLFLGYPEVEPALGVASAAVALSILCFALLVWQWTAQAKVEPSVREQPRGMAT